MWSIEEREAKFAGSPFVQYAKKEGFGLWAISSSYSILKSIVGSEKNYYELAESYARELSQHTETLYLILRKGMEESEKNHNSILYAIINLTKPNTPDSPARFLIEVSDDSSE